MLTEDKGGTEYNSIDCPNLAEATMVSCPAVDVDRFSTSPHMVRGHADRSREAPTPTSRPKQLRLAAWKASGNNMLQLEFQSKLQNHFLQDGAMGQIQHTSQVGSAVEWLVGNMGN